MEVRDYDGRPFHHHHIPAFLTFIVCIEGDREQVCLEPTHTKGKKVGELYVTIDQCKDPDCPLNDLPSESTEILEEEL